MNKMILLWGLPGDDPLVAVYDRLRQRAETVVFVNQWDILETEVELCVSQEVEGCLRIPGHTIDLSSISAVYLRPYESSLLPPVAEAGRGSEAWKHASNVEELLNIWVELTPALVINRPEAMSSNFSKPYQSNLIRAYGFHVPETLITTDAHAVRDFWQQHGEIIYKSVSAVRSLVSRLGDLRKNDLESIESCPTQFQQYVPGDDFRVHVVGEEVFACRIRSSSDDYRYASGSGNSLNIEDCRLPSEIEMRCKALSASLGLYVAGIDLRCTPEGRWYCFEVNPSPGYTFFQNATDQPIDAAIASLLSQRTR
jgi:hypothetical protein